MTKVYPVDEHRMGLAIAKYADDTLTSLDASKEAVKSLFIKKQGWTIERLSYIEASANDYLYTTNKTVDLYGKQKQSDTRTPLNDVRDRRDVLLDFLQALICENKV